MLLKPIMLKIIVTNINVLKTSYYLKLYLFYSLMFKLTYTL